MPNNFAEPPDEIRCVNCGEEICLDGNWDYPDGWVHDSNGESKCKRPARPGWNRP